MYISGDTVWYSGAAARVPEAGPFHLTMTASEGVEAARTFSSAVVVPLHFEGWVHFSEGREEIGRVFATAGMEDRLRWPAAGRTVPIGPDG